VCRIDEWVRVLAGGQRGAGSREGGCAVVGAAGRVRGRGGRWVGVSAGGGGRRKGRRGWDWVRCRGRVRGSVAWEDGGVCKGSASMSRRGVAWAAWKTR